MIASKIKEKLYGCTRSRENDSEHRSKWNLMILYSNVRTQRQRFIHCGHYGRSGFANVGSTPNLARWSSSIIFPSASAIVDGGALVYRSVWTRFLAEEAADFTSKAVARL